MLRRRTANPEVELRILNVTGTLNRQQEPATGTSNNRTWNSSSTVQQVAFSQPPESGFVLRPTGGDLSGRQSRFDLLSESS